MRKQDNIQCKRRLDSVTGFNVILRVVIIIAVIIIA